MSRPVLALALLLVAVAPLPAQSGKKSGSPTTTRPTNGDAEAPPTVRELTDDEKKVGAWIGTGTILCCGAALILGIIVWFIPVLVAVFRQHPNTAPICAVCIFLGWTFVGWLVALVWSLTAIDADRRYR